MVVMGSTDFQVGWLVGWLVAWQRRGERARESKHGGSKRGRSRSGKQKRWSLTHRLVHHGAAASPSVWLSVWLAGLLPHPLMSTIMEYTFLPPHVCRAAQRRSTSCGSAHGKDGDELGSAGKGYSQTA